MPNLLTTVTLDAASGWHHESVMNTFAFASDVAVDAAVILDIHNAVTSFYNSQFTGQVSSLASYIASTIDRTSGSMLIKSYDVTNHLDGSPYGSPIAEDAVTLGASSTAVLFPTQTAAVITTRARNAIDTPIEGAGGTRPRARKSGRLFLGPLNANAGSTATQTAQRPNATFRADCLAASCAVLDHTHQA